MAKKRLSAVMGRSQTQKSSGYWVERDSSTDRFINVKTSDKTPFKDDLMEK